MTPLSDDLSEDLSGLEVLAEALSNHIESSLPRLRPRAHSL